MEKEGQIAFDIDDKKTTHYAENLIASEMT